MVPVQFTDVEWDVVKPALDGVDIDFVDVVHEFVVEK